MNSLRYSAKTLGHRAFSRCLLPPRPPSRSIPAANNALLGTSQRQSQLFSTSYYDSQSGMHVQAHNEHEISVVLDTRKERDSGERKRDEDYVRSGISGLIENVSDSPPSDELRQFPPNLGTEDATTSLIVAFDDLDTLSNIGDRNACIEIGDDCFDEDAIQVASKVAIALDEGGNNGISPLIWLAQSNATNMDKVLTLCEELLYVDLTGSPMKARLMVNATDEEVVDEIMLLGVNKFVVQDENDVSLVKSVSDGQGKTILTRQ